MSNYIGSILLNAGTEQRFLAKLMTEEPLEENKAQIETLPDIDYYNKMKELVDAVKYSISKSESGSDYIEVTLKKNEFDILHGMTKESLSNGDKSFIHSYNRLLFVGYIQQIVERQKRKKAK